MNGSYTDRPPISQKDQEEILLGPDLLIDGDVTVSKSVKDPARPLCEH